MVEILNNLVPGMALGSVSVALSVVGVETIARIAKGGR